MTDFRESDTMSLFDKKHLVSPADALPGRNTPMPVATLHAVNGHSMTNVPDGMEIAIFAMGCFWGVERLFWQLPGVYSTAAGYTGGYTPNPTYREVCSGDTGHAEAVRIVYDPSVISYEQLLQVFFLVGRITIPPRECVRAMTTARSIVQRFIR
ncbi:hypothetical protein EIMP300_87060 [Escherichia coli]|uniref:Peptide methionine sulfoxide reductase MsrA n=1 Tax=Escherichia coli TaxID=562 RepID=A0A8S0G3G4_ECOLX|nr:hypothetical protein EIMP300_87060 [Escherichia coli]